MGDKNKKTHLMTWWPSEKSRKEKKSRRRKRKNRKRM